MENTYKFRAECLADVSQMKELFETVTVTKRENYSIEGQVTTTMTLNQVRNIVREQRDLHVIAETLATSEDFTGERTFKG